MMRWKTRPVLTIGLPVYNGERYVSDAIKSILKQTFSEFELVITDNASTDSTQHICESLARQDERIRYFRNRTNIGAAANFNLAVEYSQATKYFKWMAHDDVCSTRFLEACIEELETDDSLVVVAPSTAFIDADGQQTGIDAYRPSMDVESAVARFADSLRGHGCYEVFGVIRKAVLDHTGLIRPCSHGDGVLLAELAMHGRLRMLDEVLFLNRQHAERSSVLVRDRRSYAVWFNPAYRSRLIFPYWRLHREYHAAVNRAPLPFRERLLCRKHLLKLAWSQRIALTREAIHPVRRWMGVPQLRAAPLQLPGGGAEGERREWNSGNADELAIDESEDVKRAEDFRRKLEHV